MAKPPLKPFHIRARLQFAKRHQFWKQEFKQVIFREENNLIWMAATAPEIIGVIYGVPKRAGIDAFGGGLVMIWVIFGYDGGLALCFTYCNTQANK